jgi:hypothetical protein
VLYFSGHVDADNFTKYENVRDKLYYVLDDNRYLKVLKNPDSIGEQLDTEISHFVIGNGDKIEPAPQILLNKLETKNLPAENNVCIDSKNFMQDWDKIYLDVSLARYSYRFTRHITENDFTLYTYEDDSICNAHNWNEVRRESLFPENGYDDVLKARKEIINIGDGKPCKETNFFLRLIEHYAPEIEDDFKIVNTSEHFESLWVDLNDVLYDYYEWGEDEHRFDKQFSADSANGFYLLPDNRLELENSKERAFSAVERVNVGSRGNFSRDEAIEFFSENRDVDNGDIDYLTVNMIGSQGVPHKFAVSHEGFYLAVENFTNNFRDFYEAKQKYDENGYSNNISESKSR